MSPASSALNDPRYVADVVRSWCEKTSDSPVDGTRALMRGTAAMAARAAAVGHNGTAHALGLRFLAFERHLAYLTTGVRS